jgi:tetratricopeptide (TPR) repeat protein
MPCCIAALCWLLAAPAPDARATPQPAGAGWRILVMPFAVDVDPAAPGGAGSALWLGEAAAVLVTDGLAVRGLDVLPRTERLAAFEQLNLPMSSALTRATMIRVGELVGASAVVFGHVRLDAHLSVRARLIDLEAGAEGPAVVESSVLPNLFAAFERVSDGLATAAGRPASPKPPAAAPQSQSLEGFENFVKGLVAATPAAQQRFLELAMVESPRDGRVLVELWRVYSVLGLHDKALQAASAVPADSPLARQARFAVALALIELGRLDGAARELTTLHGERPSAAIANAMGIVELRRAGAAGAAAAAQRFEDAVRLAPVNLDYLFNLGYAQARAGSANAALGSLREVVRLDAADADAHVVMSALLSMAGRAAESQRERELAVWLGALPEAATALASVPDGLERLPRAPEADDGPRAQALREHPGQRDERATAAYHLERGRSLVEARRDRDAIAELRRAVYLDPYANEPHLLLGFVYQRGGRLAEAIDEFRVALWARETAEGQVALGTALLETGDREAARAAATRALQIDPQSVEARELLDRIGG